MVMGKCNITSAERVAHGSTLCSSLKSESTTKDPHIGRLSIAIGKKVPPAARNCKRSLRLVLLWAFPEEAALPKFLH